MSEAHKNLQRDTSCTPGYYDSEIGLNFTKYCDNNLPFSDLAQEETDTFDACMDTCSSYGALCYGVSYNEDAKKCWMKNATLTDFVSDTGTDSAVASLAQIDAVNTTCPYTPLEWITTASSLSFEIYCNRDMVGENFYPLNWQHSQHTDTLSECMDLCAEAHPLCRAVSWNAGMEMGWANCYPKTVGSVSNLTTPANYTTHTAIASFPSLNTTCVDDSLYAPTDDTSFRVSCGQKIANQTITTVHANGLRTCIDQCSSYNGTTPCVAVAFQDELTDGYQNCYLKYSTAPVVSDSHGFSIAVLTTANSSSTTESASASGGESKGVIAGAVVGAVVGAALVAALAYFLFRKRKVTKPIPVTTTVEDGAYDNSDTFIASKPQLPELSHTTAVHEMTGDNSVQLHELNTTGYHELQAWDPESPSHIIKHDTYR